MLSSSDPSSSDTNNSSDDSNKQQQGWQQKHDHPQQQERKQQQEWKQQQNRQHSRDANNRRNASITNEASNSMQAGQQQHRLHNHEMAAAAVEKSATFRRDASNSSRNSQLGMANLCYFDIIDVSTLQRPVLLLGLCTLQRECCIWMCLHYKSMCCT